MRSRPRAPAEANCRYEGSGSGAMPSVSRTWFAAPARSAAVSTSVPSRSNRTAWVVIAMPPASCLGTPAMHQVIHVDVVGKHGCLQQGVVADPAQVADFEPRRARPAIQLRGLDQLCV